MATNGGLEIVVAMLNSCDEDQRILGIEVLVGDFECIDIDEGG